MAKLRLCSGCGKGRPKFQCPTCKAAGGDEGFFCTQACFKEHWPNHRALHTSAAAAPADAAADATQRAAAAAAAAAAKEAQRAALRQAAEAKARQAKRAADAAQLTADITAALAGQSHVLVAGPAEPSPASLAAAAQLAHQTLQAGAAVLILCAAPHLAVAAYAAVRRRAAPGLQPFRAGHVFVGANPSLPLRKVAAECQLLVAVPAAFQALSPKPRQPYAAVILLGAGLQPHEYSKAAQPDARYMVATAAPEGVPMLQPCQALKGLQQEPAEDDPSSPAPLYDQCDDYLTHLLLQTLHPGRAAEHILKAIPPLSQPQVRQSVRCVVEAMDPDDVENGAHALALSLLVSLCSAAPKPKFGKCSAVVMGVATALRSALQAHPVLPGRPPRKGRWYFHAAVAHAHPHVEPEVMDDIAQALDVRWLVKPPVREPILVKYGHHADLYECVHAVLQHALRYLSVGGHPKDRDAGDLHNGQTSALLEQLCWPELLAPLLGPHKNLLKQEASVYYPQCSRTGDKFNDGTLRVFASTKFPDSTTFPVCTQKAEQRKVLIDQAIQEVLLMMPAGDGLMMAGQLGAQLGGWQAFCNKYAVDLAPSLRMFFQKFPEHFTLCEDERLVKRTVAAPGHVQVVMPTGRAVSGLDGDDEDGQKKKKPVPTRRGRMAKVKQVRMEVLARRVARKTKISKLKKKKTAPTRKRGRGLMPRRKVF
eukprot:EG_transcript_4041